VQPWRVVSERGGHLIFESEVRGRSPKPA
jgi:hypothetical protein